MELMTAMVLSDNRPRLAAMGLAVEQVRKVVLSPTRTLLAIPGRAGIHITVRSSGQGARAGASTKVDGCLEGQPIMSVGPHLVGLAVDGVQQQPVEFRDGSIGHPQ